MADKKITEYGQIDTVAQDDILPIVDVSDTTQSAQGSSKWATVSQVLALASATANPAVENSYLTVTEMLDDQGNQVAGNLQYVADASLDPAISSGDAYYNYLGTTDGDLDDYNLLTEQDIIAYSLSINTCIVQEVADTASATVSTETGVNVEYESTDVVAFVFNETFTDYLVEVKDIFDGGGNFKVKVFNAATNRQHILELDAIDYSDGTYTYMRVEVGTGMTTARVSDFDRLDVYFDYYESAGTTPDEEDIIGTRQTNSNVSGSTALDWAAYKVFELTLTGAATLTDSNLPTSTDTKVIELVIDGDETLTLPAYWEPMPDNDAYDGTVRNHLVVSCISGSANDVLYSLTNLLS